MLKRFFIAIALICAIPLSVQAASWFLSTQARTMGGTIWSPNMSGQTVSDGAIFRAYSTQGRLDVTITAKTGYTIRNVTINQTQQTLSDSRYFSTSVQGWNQLTGEATDQSVTATFLPNTLSISASNSHGSVTPSRLSSITYGYTLSSPITFYFLPAYGYEITNIKNLPASPLVTHSPFSPGVNMPVTVTFATGYVLTESMDLAAEVANVTPYLRPILPQVVKAGAKGVTLTAEVANNVGNRRYNYAWSYASGPANFKSYRVDKRTVYVTEVPGPALTLAKTDSAETSFNVPSMPGQYKFVVTASASGQPDLTTVATVNVVASSTIPLKTRCQVCHTASDVGDAELFNNWSSSAHRGSGVTCESCHAGASAKHPGTTDGNVCANCHLGSDGNVPKHNVAIGGVICTTCHDPHSGVGVIWGASPQHFNNLTSAGYPASYVTSGAKCSDCHDNSAKNAKVRSQWGASGHAATTDAPWRDLDFKTVSGCVQCHSTTGFVAYSTGKVTAAWGSAADKTKEVLSCIGCHSDISTGAVRRVTPVQPFSDDPAVNHDFGISNICMACHSGRNSGASIRALLDSADFRETPFVTPHSLAAGAILQGRGGYHFAGQSYSSYSSNNHRLIGVANKKGTGNSGPCVACHMSGAEKHLFQVVATDSGGNLASISATVCVNCHGSFFQKTLVQERQGYRSALNVLKAMLANRGFAYSSDYPYFSNLDWGSGESGAELMGAAFNYRMLLAEPGAYAHNSAYAKKLVTDSIDVLYNGSVTGSVETALTYLVQQGAISQETAEQFVSYAGAGVTTP